MKRRIDLICAVYMAIIVCLAGVLVFLVYQQGQIIEEQGQYIRGFQNQQPEIIVEYIQCPPKIVVETIYVDKPVDRIVEKVIIEEREVEVVVITYRNIYARHWESVEQFEQWYEDLDFRVLMPSSVYIVDCDDYSARLQRLALEQGYSVSEALAKNRLYCGVKVTKAGGIHAGNLVLIDNAYYWVEPQPDIFNIKRLFDRD